MARYDEDFFDEMVSLFRLAAGRHFLIKSLLTVIPTYVVFRVESGVLFMLYFSTVCMLSRSVRLGGVIGWFITAQMIFMYCKFPMVDHFVEIILRAPARSSGVIPSSEQVLGGLPVTVFGQLFFSAVLAIRGGFVGLGCGFLGVKILRRLKR